MTTTVSERSIDPNLFAWPESHPALLAGRCRECEGIWFPAGPSCEACGSENVYVERLPKRGKLWTWTIQRFMPKTPYNSSDTQETFKPYGVAYLEFSSGLKIEGRVMCDNPENLYIGQPMEVAFYIHRVEDDGTAVINYAFKPI